MAELRDVISDDESVVSTDSLDESQREQLNRQKLSLERELNSLSAMLTKSRKSRSVPIHETCKRGNISVAFSAPIHSRSQRGTTSLRNEPPFYGFPDSSPPRLRHCPTLGANIWMTDVSNESVREHQTTPTGQQSTQLPTSQQHHEVNVIMQHNASANNSVSSSHWSRLKPIDEWIEDAIKYNAKRKSIQSESINHESPRFSQIRDNNCGSTKVELRNTTIIDHRHEESGVDFGNRHELIRRNSSMDGNGIDSRSTHRSLLGSTEVELLKTHKCHDTQRRDSPIHLERFNQRTHSVCYQSMDPSTKYHPLHDGVEQRVCNQHPTQQLQSLQNVMCSGVEQRRCNQHPTQQLQSLSNVVCSGVDASYFKPQNVSGGCSTKVELRNAPQNQKFCDRKYERTIDQKDQPQVSIGKSGNVNKGKNQFPFMDVPNCHSRRCKDQQGCATDIHPFKDQQRYISGENWTSRQNKGESYDRPKPHDGFETSHQDNCSHPKPLTEIPIPQTQIEANTAIMTKIVSRQILGNDLPKFSGEISQWLSFYDHYKDTTDSCNYTDRENTMRLRKCLEGKAKRLVEPLLISSTNATTIIETLKRRYGRPDDIIKHEIKKAKSTPSPKDNDPISIIDFSTAVTNLVVTLETLQKPDHLRNPVLLDDLQDKLPPTLSLLWSEYLVDRTGDLTLKVLSDWLVRRAEAASRRTTYNVYQDESTSKTNTLAGKQKARVNTLQVTSTESCFSCQGTCTSLESCEAFSKLDVHKRWDIVKKNKLCFFCLSTKHGYKDCLKKAECKFKGCKRYHHKLLHTDGSKVGIISVNFKPYVTKLRIVPITIFGKSTEIRTFALLDNGSTSTLMSERLRNLLKLDGPTSPLLLEWMNGDIAVENESKIVDTKVQGTFDGAKIYDLYNVRTVKNLPLHKQTINKSSLVKQWPYLRTVDFESYEDAQPELLIGENNGLLISTRQLVHDKWNTPIASRTWLGWVISGNEGKSAESIDSSIIKVFTAREIETDELHELVKSSFTIENDGVNNDKLSRSKEDERALELLDKYSTLSENRWETGLLWRDEEVILPESRRNAFLRLLILEKKLDKNTVLRQRYNEIIGEYLKKKFLRKCEPSDTKFDRSWYLPHFPVINPLKPGKVRIVFDAAAKSNGFSLNDFLMPGPDLLKSLVGVLFKFRHGKIAFLGDIKEMFPQIKVRRPDASCQKILWRGDKRTGNPEEYEVDVLTFGANCSPCSAIYIKDKNAERFRESFPKAVDAILHKHYMDDYLDSTTSEVEAIQMINDVIHVHRQGSFEICNWTSNSQKVIQAIPEHLRRNYSSKVNFDREQLQNRVLGVLWDPIDDVFTFNTNFAKIDKNLLSGQQKPTKREVLSIINSVFDPLGFIGHLMIIGKIILKNVWHTGIDWDDVIDDTNFITWKSFLGHMQRITEVKIDRCYSVDFMHADNLQLHVFCDASTEGYCAIAFVRIQVAKQVEIKLVMGKTRVAPTKKSSNNSLTIPRLELESALLASKISRTIVAEHNVKFDDLVLWTDNTAVYYWIKSETTRYKQFVANRLDQILEITNASNWMWVPSELNPADNATRSDKVPEFNNQACWYRGPDFLYNDRIFWPQQPGVRPPDDLAVLELNNFIIEMPNFQLPDPTRFSKWQRILRTTSWILRFVDNCNKNRIKVKGFELTVNETTRAEELLIKDSQRRCFAKEIMHLQSGRNVHNSSRLYTLSPKLDENGIIRMCGRTSRLPDTFRGLKEPVILDGKDYLVKLLIRFFHEKANHLGHEMVLNEIRQRYWVIGAKVALRSVRQQCTNCKLLLAKPTQTIMGQLPSARLIGHNPPFAFCAVDYFGPILVKVRRSTEKRYGVLFTCLTTRAVHMEIASSMTTDSCIMALRRFIAKYGCPKDMFSDNGTNLRGCDNELRANLAELDQDRIKSWATTHRISWHFNPPTASSMGGAWERLVRSIKTALYATLNEVHPSEEVLATLLAEAQHVTNSRPLLEISDHPDEEETLTPNHFLIGRSSASAPIGEFDSDDLILKKQWRAAQYLADLFWKRWVKEYLPTLTKRTKWFLIARKPKVGDLVLIADSDEKRGTWPRGIITAVYPGIDDEIRVVDVTTNTGTYRRPMNKICLLESTVVAGEHV